MASATESKQSQPPGQAGRTQRSAAQEVEGERRLLTVLFCDVVNSTGLAERLDPEDWTEVMNGAFEHLTAPIHRYEGTVAKLIGDGMLAFFGAPAAHEDDPQRAVLAGLDIIDAVKNFGVSLKAAHGIEFDVRVGINTGLVVMADMGSGFARERTAMGDAVNVAARMEQTASPGTVQVSGETYRLIAPLFDVLPLGDIELKGKSEPVPAYRILWLRTQPGRLRGILGVDAPLIGRETELKLLKDTVDRLREGRGQVVCLIGEAGLGKSRLLAELNKYWNEGGNPERWEMMYGVPFDSTRPFGLFQNYARGMFGIQLDDPAEVIHKKVVAQIRAGGGTEDAVALCAVAFERVIAAKVLHEAQDFPAEAIKQDIYDVMYPGLRESCSGAPMVMVAEDLHWSDAASVDLLIHLLPLVDEVPILFLCAFRPERLSPAWTLKLRAETDLPHRYTEINLKPLADDDTDALISALLRTADLPPELRQLILKKAEGNPYFVEEIVRSLIEEGIVYRTEDGLKWKATTVVADIAIPDSLQSLLMARIDRLDRETKSTLQMASVIGRSFYYRILRAISDSTIAVDKHLRSLERVELLREANRLPELEYIFKHELARDAAYATILNRKRRELHKRVGEAIESTFADRLHEHAHRLALHFEFAGDLGRAAKYFEMAAEAAAAVHAKPEARALYERAVASAQKAGLSSDGARLETALRAI